MLEKAPSRQAWERGFTKFEKAEMRWLERYKGADKGPNMQAFVRASTLTRPTG